MRAILLTAGLLASFSSSSQTLTRGIVVDSLTRQPIAFASIVLDDNRTGTSSDIEGKFSFTIPKDYAGSITLSHISYQKKE
ncbi:MAG: carboxypeptidase-like regulatory domain-containing protein [Cyclobacteriaceae bacterium]